MSNPIFSNTVVAENAVGWCKLCGKAFYEWDNEITRHMIEYHNVFTYSPNEMQDELVQD